MTGTIRVVSERGPKGKKTVAFALDWPGWSRGATTRDAALEVLASYRERYRPVARCAGFESQFDESGVLEIVEDVEGTGSTDFWGISWTPATEEREPMTGAACERKIALLESAWVFFDNVSSRVSAELKKGPRGGGRNRDEVISHTFGTERDFAKKVEVITPPGVMLTADGLHQHREDYVAALREYNAQGRMARSWTLQFLIRHSAYHVLDHAWELEDKDLPSTC